MQQQLGEQREAIASFVEAGKNYLKADHLNRGMKSFEKGLNMAVSEMSPSSVGWYCFKNIAIDLLIIKHSEKAKEWINKGVEFFAKEYEVAVKRVNGYIRVCEEKTLKLCSFPKEDIEKIIKNKKTIERIEKKYQEIKRMGNVGKEKELTENIRRCSWAWLCLGLLYQKGPTTDEWRAKEAFENSSQYFSIIEDQYMISYIEKYTKA